MTGGWKRALVLAPHTDDGEFGCGGTMARLVEEGADVRYVAFSIATRSLPEGFAPVTPAESCPGRAPPGLPGGAKIRDPGGQMQVVVVEAEADRF